MKKLIISGLFCSVLVLGGFQVASAQETTVTSNTSLSAKIQDLMKLIADLQTRLAEAKGEVKELVADLEEGAQGEDIKKVQEVLATDPSIFSVKPTGYFGTITKEALKKFQERYGLEVTGKLDEGTREAIKELRKDGVVAPGLLQSAAVKDRIKARLQDKWGDCDFTLPFRASLCEKVKDVKDVKDEKKDKKDKKDKMTDDDDDDDEATRVEAMAAIKKANQAIIAFKAEVNDEEDDEDDEDIEDAQEMLSEAKTKIAEARRAFVKQSFDDAVEKAEAVIDIINDNDDSDEDEDEDEDRDADDDTEEVNVENATRLK